MTFCKIFLGESKVLQYLLLTPRLRNWRTTLCCILIIYTYTNICDFNERTNTLLYKNIPLALYSRKGDVSCVWEVSWRRGQTATYWPKVLLIIAALFSRGSLRATSPPSAAGSQFGILSPTDSNSNWNWNWSKPSVAPGYIIVSHPPASAVPPLIYTGASLDRRLGRGSIYNTITEQLANNLKKKKKQNKI